MRRCICSIVVCAMAIAAFGDESQHPARPSLIVDETRIDLGEIVAGERQVELV